MLGSNKNQGGGGGGVLLGLRAKFGPCGRNWLIKTKNNQVMTTQRWAKSSRAANFEPISRHLSHIFEIRPPYLFCQTVV